MFRAIFHKFDSSARPNRNKVLLSDLLDEVVLTDNAEEPTFDLLQRLRVNAHIVVMEVELFLFGAQTRFHLRVIP